MGQKSRRSLIGSSAEGVSKLQSRWQLGLWSPLRLGSPCQASVVVGGISFIAAEELKATHFLKVSRRVCPSPNDLPFNQFELN